jgi:hypothetical protein
MKREGGLFSYFYDDPDLFIILSSSEKEIATVQQVICAP